MPAPTGPTMDYGLREVIVYELNDELTPAATGPTAYEGYKMRGATAYEFTPPDSREIVGLGEDGITQVAFLPPNETAKATLNADASDPTLAAKVDGTLVRTIGNASLVGGATDKQGEEPSVGVLLRQASRDLATGKAYWHHYILPSVQMFRKGSGMADGKAVTKYQIACNRVSAHLWGEPFTEVLDGYENSQYVEMWSDKPGMISSFLADGTATEFPFGSASYSTTGMSVFADRIKVTSGLTLATTKITFAVAPTAGTWIDVLRF